MAATLLVTIASTIAAYSYAHTDLLRFDEFEFKFNVLNKHNKHHRNLIFDNTNDPFDCTDIIPIIFKNLCFRWDTNDGFKYGFNTDNILNDIISMNDDNKWDEINYGTNYTKQCRYISGRQECIHYSSPSNAVTFRLKIGTNREPRNGNNFNILPANIYNVDNDIYNGQDIDQFAFGNNIFNQHQYLPIFGNNHNSIHQFGYGDALGFDRWASDIMDWKGFNCDFCDDSDSVDDVEDNNDIKFSSYGDYTYLFNEHEIDISAEKMECSPIISGLGHKVCITSDHAIYFKKDDMDNTLDPKLQNEFDGEVLYLNNDSLWDDITTLYDKKSVRKCKTFQIAQFCVTEKENDYLTINVKVGTHKLHRMDDVFGDMMDDLIGDDDDGYYYYYDDEPDEDDYNYDNYNYDEYEYEYDDNELTEEPDTRYQDGFVQYENGDDDVSQNKDTSDAEPMYPVSSESFIMDEMWLIWTAVAIGAISMCCLMICMVFIYWKYWAKLKKENENKNESECDITITTPTEGETLQ